MTTGLSHAAVWSVIDALAAKKGLSIYGLAARCGVAANTLYKAKRADENGKPRWPTLPTIALILKATDTTFVEFAGMTANAEKLIAAGRLKP